MNSLLGSIILMLGCAAAAWLLFRSTYPNPARRRDKIGFFLFLPCIVTLAFMALGQLLDLISPGNCSSNAGGICFQLGLLVGFVVLPLACLTTPLAIAWHFIRKFRK